MHTLIEHITLLLSVAILVALLAHRLRQPYTVGLVVTGIILNLSHINLNVTLTHAFIFDVILPPLLFEAALNIHWQELRKDLLPVLLLSTAGVALAAASVGWGMTYLLHWPLSSALIFGILIAATDPVAVIAMFKDNGIKGRLRLLVESESLFNDGVAAVLFALALAWATGATETADITSAIRTLALTVGGGMAVGAAFGAGATLIAGRAHDHLVETALTTVVAYGSFMFAEHFHSSGVLASVTAGILMGNSSLFSKTDHAASSPEPNHNFILDFWEFVAFLANSFVFLLIGLRVASLSFPLPGTTLLPIIGLVLASRAITVYPLCLPFMRSRWRISPSHQHILWWGGLRGALGLALALALPDSLPMRDEIVVSTFGVVVFSVVIQGITMPLLLKRMHAKERKPRRNKR